MRRPQRVVIYQRLYKAKIKAAVDEEAKRVGAKLSGEVLKIRREISQKLLDSEPPSIQHQIDEEVRKWVEEHEKGLQEGTGEGEERTAEDYQK